MEAKRGLSPLSLPLACLLSSFPSSTWREWMTEVGPVLRLSDFQAWISFHHTLSHMYLRSIFLRLQSGCPGLVEAWRHRMNVSNAGESKEPCQRHPGLQKAEILPMGLQHLLSEESGSGNEGFCTRLSKLPGRWRGSPVLLQVQATDGPSESLGMWSRCRLQGTPDPRDHTHPGEGPGIKLVISFSGVFIPFKFRKT